MADPHVAQKFPYVLSETPGKRAWCACGQSKNQPFCDGSHRTVPGGFAPLVIEIKEPKQVAWCGCKHSATKPFCDGSHKKLP